MKKIFVVVTATLLGVTVQAATTTINSWKALENVLTSNKGAPLTVHKCILKKQKRNATTLYDLTAALQGSAALGHLDLSVLYNKNILTGLKINLPQDGYNMDLEFSVLGKRYSMLSSGSGVFLINIGDGASVFAKAPYYQNIQTISNDRRRQGNSWLPSPLSNLLSNNGSTPIRIIAAQWYGYSDQNTQGEPSRSPTQWSDMTNEIQAIASKGNVTVDKIKPVADGYVNNITTISIMFIINNVVYQSSFSPSGNIR